MRSSRIFNFLYRKPTVNRIRTASKPYLRHLCCGTITSHHFNKQKHISMLRFALLALLFSAATSIYDFKVPGLDGNGTIDLSKYRGKKILIVNTASKCGNTPQYAAL